MILAAWIFLVTIGSAPVRESEMFATLEDCDAARIEAIVTLAETVDEPFTVTACHIPDTA